MTTDTLLTLTDIDTGKPDDLIRAVIAGRGKTGYAEARKEYDPKEHKVMKPQFRPDKIKKTKTGTKDSKGSDQYETRIEHVNRTPLPIQQLIVKQAAAFIAGNGVTFSAPSETEAERTLTALVRKLWDDNKMSFRNRDIVRRLLSETEVAEVWYSRLQEKNGAIDIRCKVYSPSMGCELYPIFDDEDDLVAFGIQTHRQAEKKGIFDLYLKNGETCEKIRYENTNGTWKETSRVDLPYGKLPVIYYSIPEPDWTVVQPLIERLEKILSNFADTNDYHASPTLAFIGKVSSLPEKGSTSKAVQMEPGGSVEYVTWPGAPEAIKLEMETLLKHIYMCTQTINFSSEEMKGLGTISGTAWDRISTPANLKASDYQDGVFGEGVQRRINFLKSVVAAIPANNVSVDVADKTLINPVFSLFRPDDLADRVELYMKGNGGQPVFTLEESIQGVGASSDAAKTAQTIREEQQLRTPSQSSGNDTRTNDTSNPAAQQ